MNQPPVTKHAVVTPEKRDLARGFRKLPTETEAAAWEMVRNRRCLGLKFRRQQVIRGFIVDFYCAELRLAIELDGGVHEQQAEYDAARDEALRTAGITVVRMANHNLSPESLADLIQTARSSPSPLRERGPGGEVS